MVLNHLTAETDAYDKFKFETFEMTTKNSWNSTGLIYSLKREYLKYNDVL